MALHEKYNEQVQFIVVDVQSPQSAQLVQMFKVQYIPAIFFIDSQNRVEEMIVGDTTKDKLESNIKKIID
ncbi:thioredoxin domain-containing protein [Metallumcola ferriviriculae]|uniref:Thioredoxin domain-containing protein n=1 Tax=Metallumcola ferriviriculae TaxID=3039180 RepID=A0AAU0UQD7_9FIRM|nr:thioredoxin domain-containing protein [Desulfitibacteraceae bacterium MK1]